MTRNDITMRREKALWGGHARSVLAESLRLHPKHSLHMQQYLMHQHRLYTSIQVLEKS